MFAKAPDPLSTPPVHTSSADPSLLPLASAPTKPNQFNSFNLSISSNTSNLMGPMQSTPLPFQMTASTPSAPFIALQHPEAVLSQILASRLAAVKLQVRTYRSLSASKLLLLGMAHPCPLDNNLSSLLE